MSFSIILYALLNLSLSTAYKGVAVTGEYPEVLPQASARQAVGYDSSTHTIYILGGNSGKEVVAYNINDMTFEDLGTDFLVAGTSGVGFYTQNTNINTDLWMINGGGTGFIKFNTHSRSMDIPQTEFPTNISPHACLAGHGNYLFVVGGWYNSEMQRIVQIYDMLHNEWITNMPLMQESRAVCGCVVNNNRLYVVAGLKSDTVEWINIADIEKIDKQQWRYVNGHLPTTLRGNTVVNYGNQIIILGGRSDDGSQLFPTSIPVVNVGSNHISIKGSLAYNTDEAGAVIVGRRVFVFGGADSTGTIVTSYQYIDLPEIVDSKSMSGGSIFLLILFLVLIVYCIGGYVFNGWKSKKWGDVKGNIPQFGFWKHVPLLIFTGCKISYDYCNDYCRGKVNGDQRQELIETNEDNAL